MKSDCPRTNDLPQNKRPFSLFRVRFAEDSFKTAQEERSGT